MIKYLNEIFGVCARIENWDGKNKLPLYLRNKRDYFVLSIEGMQSILMRNRSDGFHVSVFKKEMQEIGKISGLTVVLWLDAVSTYQRNALIKNRISFIVPDSQVYVPEWGTCLKEFCAGKREKVEKVSASTQFLLLYFIYQKYLEEKSQTELAFRLNLSAMSVSRAVQDLQELNLLNVRKEGSSKYVKSAAVGKELYHLSNQYMQSPVQKKVYANRLYFDRSLPYAGETALAWMSMLSHPRHMVFAADKKLAKDIPEEYFVNPKLTADNDYVEIELWKYDPRAFARDNIVDIVSLVQSLKDVGDERVEMQVKKILEEYRW